MTKRLQSTGAWSAGNNGNLLLSGARANSSTYHLFALYKTDGTVDYGALLGVAGTTPDPTLPTGYTKYQYITSLLTDASGNIRAGKWTWSQTGEHIFEFNSYVQDRSLSAPPTTASNITLASIPVGLEVKAISIVGLQYFSTSTNTYLIYEKTSFINNTPSQTNYTMFAYASSYASSNNQILYTLTNKSSQVQIRASSTGHSLEILGKGWQFINKNS
jgi:hypothetical protein